MKKLTGKIKVMCAALLSVLLLTGCMRIGTTIKILSPEKCDISVFWAIKAETVDQMGMDAQEFLDSEMNSLLDQMGEEVTVNIYEDLEDGYIGFEVIAYNMDLEDTVSSSGEPVLTEGEDGVYTLNIPFGDLSMDISGMGDMRLEDLEAYRTYFKDYGGYIEMAFELPYPAIDTNADIVEENGRLLKWDLMEAIAGGSIEATFRFIPEWMPDEGELQGDESIPGQKGPGAAGATQGATSYVMIWIIVGIAALILIAVIVTLIIVLSRKKKKKAQAAQAQMPYYQQPQAPQYPQYQQPQAPQYPQER